MCESGWVDEWVCVSVGVRVWVCVCVREGNGVWDP